MFEIPMATSLASFSPVAQPEMGGVLLPNRSIDADVHSTGFARLLAAGHLQR
jgi:hypothetical protein